MEFMERVRENPEYDSQIKACAREAFAWAMLKDKTVLITGATGMIGIILIDILMRRNREHKENIHVIAVGRNEEKAGKRLGRYLNDDNFSFLCQDVCEKSEFVKCDYIIHGASNTHPLQYAKDPIGTIRANVSGTENMLELAAAQENCRLLFLSSVEVYGESRDGADIFDEAYCGYIDCNTMRAGYPESKRLGEAMIQAYIAQKGADAVIVRLSRTYGPTMQPDDSKAIAQFIQKAVHRMDIVLKSEGKQVYSYIYAADAARAVLKILLSGQCGEAYNAAGLDSDLSLRELADMLAKEAGTNVIFELPDALEKSGYSTATKAVLNTDKLRRLGWESRFDMEEGLSCTVRMLRDAELGG